MEWWTQVKWDMRLSVKVRIQTLVEELDISTQTIVNWLSRRGYPGARPQDWLTPKLVELAKRELGSRVHQPSSLRSSRTLQHHRTSSNFSRSLNVPSSLLTPTTPHMTTAYPHSRMEDDQLSESGMLEELPDLSMRAGDHDAQGDQGAEGSLLDRERKRADLLLKRLEGQRNHYEHKYAELRQRYEQTVGERTQLRRNIYEMKQNQETLDQTCRELAQELEQTKREVGDLRRNLTAQEKMSSAIDQVTQQKKAWRAKALALEEKVQTNQQITTQLRELGMESFEQQVQLFQTLLMSPESASQLFHAIKMVEYDDVRKMVDRWVVKTCYHPLCQQVNQLRGCLSLRVDRPHHCHVCHGKRELRWFKRMMASCERAHVRRFLLVGGEDLHDEIRKLTEGKSIDFRLISSQDESTDQRIQSRLESCDLLISWARGSLSSPTSLRYLKVADQIKCPSVVLGGDEAKLDQLARNALNWVTRTGGRTQ